MIICGIVGATYIVIMLGLLLCFLRKYHCNSPDSSTCQQIEMRPVPQPYQYCSVVNQSSDSITRSCATRSNRSYGSRRSSHIYQKPQVKKVLYVKTLPDISQMERLATLWDKKKLKYLTLYYEVKIFSILVIFSGLHFIFVEENVILSGFTWL